MNVRDGFFDPDGLAFLDEQQARSLDNVVLAEGDVLLNITGASVARVCRLPTDLAGGRVNQHVAIIRPKPDLIDPAYLEHCLIAPDVKRRLLVIAGSGATREAITKSAIEDFEIPVPPLSAQRRIAAILDQADALRAKRRAALAQLDEMARAIFVEMFGDPNTKSSRSPTKPFGEICETRLGKMLDQKKQTGLGRKRYLRNANVRWFGFELTGLLEMDFTSTEQAIFELRAGDILICEGGEPGRAAIWEGQIADCFYQKALHRARPRAGLAIAQYLVWVLWFLAHGGGLKDHVTVATIAHLTKEKLDTLPIPLAPLSEQQEFADRMNNLDAVRKSQLRAAAEADALFTAIQHRAFRGEL